MKKNHTQPEDMVRKNMRTGLTVLAVVFMMTGLAFASVPLYNLFCRVTGFAGTTGVSDAYPQEIVNRTITVHFSSQTGANLPWDFKPEMREVKLKLGERGFMNFFAHNTADIPTGGTAIYNVTPLKAGAYFQKVQCFCFDQQILNPGQQVPMPVMFFIDPALHDDPLMNDVTTITLSYTFYKSDSEELESALEDFYNIEENDINNEKINTSLKE